MARILAPAFAPSLRRWAARRAARPAAPISQRQRRDQPGVRPRDSDRRTVRWSRDERGV